MWQLILLKKNPIIRVFNIENDLSQDKLIQDISVRNEIDKKNFSINYIYENNQRNSRNLIMSVCPETYMKLRNSKYILAIKDIVL